MGKNAAMRAWLRDHGLLLANLALFVIFIGGMVLSGVRVYNSEQTEHGGSPVSLGGYLKTGDFVEATFENWESEFLQMAGFVLLTVFLRQKGSPESKRLESEEAVDEDPQQARTRQGVPGPVRRGGLALVVYQNSLSLALGALFLLSFLLHALGGRAEYNHQQLQHGGAPTTLLGFVTSSQFWFQSFQNWQSEFLSTFALVVLGIYLRQRGSPESKPVAAPHGGTGH